MEHADHVALIRNGIEERDRGGVWAELGSGSGAFTLALAELLGPGAIIYSLDRDGRALREQGRAMRTHFPDTTLHAITVDYTGPFPSDVPLFDGVLLANTLHIQPERERGQVLDQLHAALRPGGRLIVVEYNTDRGNRWVPHPFSFPSWQRLAREHGFTDTRLLASRPSRFLGEIYAASSTVSTEGTASVVESAAAEHEQGNAG